MTNGGGCGILFWKKRGVCVTKEEVLRTYFGYSSFRAGQERIIDAVLAGRDCLCVMPTGAGKSVCYQVPALLLPGVTVVISPLISLMKDQVSALLHNGIRAAYLNSSLTPAQYDLALSRMAQGQYKIVYVAPERLDTPSFRAVCARLCIPFVAVDEAHCVSQWGQDFRPGYLKIRAFTDFLPERPTVAALTATATAAVRRDIAAILDLHDPVAVTTGFDRPNLFFGVRHPQSKEEETLAFVREHPGQSGIVYCNTRSAVESVCERLCRAGIPVTRYHAGLSDEERQRNQEDFVCDRVQVMVATNAFGMGIDKPDVSFVLHYNMPKNPESYYQEAGRAGRDGMPAECVLLYSGRDVHTNRYMIEHGEPNPELTPAQAHTVREQELDRLRKMTFYCTTTDCLRAFLLRYFGEETGKGGEYGDNCGNCSNCLRARRLAGEQAAMPEQPDGTDVTDAARHMLGLIAATGQRYGMLTVIDALRGSKSEKIRRFRLDRQADYGALSALSAQQVRAIFEEMTARGYVRIGGGEYPAAMLGPRAQALTEGGERLWVRLPREKEKAAGRKKSAGAAKTGTADAAAPQESELMHRLRRLRMEIATREGVPAYVIFPNSTLYVMCISLPTRRESFLLLPGVGQVKCDKYGRMFCDLIREYLDEQKRNGGTGNG